MKRRTIVNVTRAMCLVSVMLGALNVRSDCYYTDTADTSCVNSGDVIAKTPVSCTTGGESTATFYNEWIAVSSATSPSAEPVTLNHPNGNTGQKDWDFQASVSYESIIVDPNTCNITITNPAGTATADCPGTIADPSTPSCSLIVEL